MRERTYLRKSFKIKETCIVEENMSLINFLRKIFSESKVEEPVRTPEKISFSGVQNWVSNKEEEIKAKEKKLLSSVNNKISYEIKNLETQLEALEKYDFERRKDKEKVELIVKENWKNYVYYVQKFIINFRELQESNFERYIVKSNEIFVNFDQKSHSSYEKATFLIGKEMANVRNSIVTLSKYFSQMFEENKSLIKDSKKISSMKSKLEQFDIINSNIQQSDKKIISIGDKIADLKEKEKKLLEEVEKTSKTPDHIDNLNKKNKLIQEKLELDKEIYKLKEIIDFKHLANIFHSDKKRSDIVKSYKDNFQKSFYKDNGGEILSLISETSLNKNLISEKINNINQKKEEIVNQELLIKEDATTHLLDKIDKIKTEIHNLNHEKEEEIKIKEKLNSRKQENINSIKEEMKEFDVVVEDLIENKKE